MSRNVFPRPLVPEEFPELVPLSPVEGAELTEGGLVGGVGFIGSGPVAGFGFPNAGLVGRAPGFVFGMPLVPLVGGVITGGALAGGTLVTGGLPIIGGGGRVLIPPPGMVVPKPLSIFVPLNRTPHRGQLVYGLIGVELVPSEAPHFSHDHE